MKLEDQVTSLELSKKLKELGVKQESYFFWVYRPAKKKKHMPKFTQIEESYHVENLQPEWQKKFIESDRKLRKNDAWIKWLEGFKFWSAFTVAELGQMLPKELKVKDQEYFIDYSWQDESELWEAGYFEVPVKGTRIYPYVEIEETEADARAKMLIYLIKHKLITL